MDQGIATIFSGIIQAIAVILAAFIGLYVTEPLAPKAPRWLKMIAVVFIALLGLGTAKLFMDNSSLNTNITQSETPVEASKNAEASNNTEAESEESDSSTTIEELRSTISEKDKKIAELNNTISEKDDEIAELNNTISEKDEQIATLSGTITDLQNAVIELENIIAEHEDQDKPTAPVAPDSSTEAEFFIPYLYNEYWTSVYDGSDHTRYYTVGGKEYKTGVYLSGHDPYAIWNTDKKYQKMSFKILSDCNHNSALTILVDNAVFETRDLQWDDPEEEIVVELNYAKNVKIEINSYGYSVSWGMYDICFYP